MSTLFPGVDAMRDFLEAAIANDWTVVTWNGLFDVAILIAYGLRDLVFKVKWLDGLLLWKHLEIDPEYDVDKPKKKSYSLKPDAVLRFIPSSPTPPAPTTSTSTAAIRPSSPSSSTTTTATACAPWSSQK
jgi:hypothetical protein